MKTGKKRKSKKKPFFMRILLVLALGAAGAASVQQVPIGGNVADSLGEVVGEAKEVLRQTSQTASSLSPGIEMPVVRKQVDTRILSRTGYTLSYNDAWRIPNWVAWELTPEEVKGKVKRTDFFEADPDLPARVRSEHRDYSGSKYDRGHMAPAGDMKWDEKAMQESFYMSNMCPQAPELNKGCWRILEEQCRHWAQRYSTSVYIACGPIMSEDMKHKYIGRSKVAVPDGFFKVVLRLGRKPAAVGFIFPNDDCNHPLKEYAVSVDDVEKLTGIDFFHQLPDEQEEALEAQMDVNW